MGESSRSVGPLPVEVEAVLRVFGRRTTHFLFVEPGPLELHTLNLDGAEGFFGGFFHGTSFIGSTLRQAHLASADLSGSSLASAKLDEARLEGADLVRSHILQGGESHKRTPPEGPCQGSPLHGRDPGL
jgi:hypothetical protein